jgi:hypothetical protein
MDDKRITKIAAYGFVGLVVAPIVVRTGLRLIGAAANGINKLAWNHKIKKGLTNGSIVEIDGEYYEATIE